MKLITIPHSALKNLPPMTRAEWSAFLRSHGVELEKVKKVSGDREKTVYELED